MNDQDFFPHWQKDFQNLRRQLQPALVISDQLKWMQEINIVKDHFWVPNPIKDIINSDLWNIYKSNHDLFTNMTLVNNQLNHALFSKTHLDFVGTLNKSLKIISNHAIAINDFPFLKVFNETSSKIKEATIEIKDKEVVSREDIKNIKIQLNELGELLNNKMNKGFEGKQAKISWHLTIISFILTLYSLCIPYLQSNNNEENATISLQKDIIQTDLKNLFDSVLNIQSKSKYTRVATNLYLKPAVKSLKTGRINKSEKVQILCIHKKWALISFVNEEGILETGWLLKKYLNTKHYSSND